MKKRYRYIVASFFIIFIGGFFIINSFKEDSKISEIENRKLAKKPKFSIDNLIEGRFTKKYEKYKNDQFFMRDEFIFLKGETDRIIGKKDNNGIYFGKDEFLIEDFKKPKTDEVEKNLLAINKFAKKNDKINTYFMLVPNAISIYKDRLPQNAPILDQEKAINDYGNLLTSNIEFINPTERLKSKKDNEIYYATDHHWTTEGAYYAYLEMAEKMNIEHKEMDYYDIKTVTDTFVGTLASRSTINTNRLDEIKLFVPKDEDDKVIVQFIEEKKKVPTLYNSDALNTRDKYGVFLGGNKPIVKISTTSKEDKKLLLLKDSYANSFVQFLTPYYSDIVMVDPRYYYDNIDNLIEEEEITDILYLYNANTFFQDNSISSVLGE